MWASGRDCASPAQVPPAAGNVRVCCVLLSSMHVWMYWQQAGARSAVLELMHLVQSSSVHGAAVLQEQSNVPECAASTTSHRFGLDLWADLLSNAGLHVCVVGVRLSIRIRLGVCSLHIIAIWGPGWSHHVLRGSWGCSRGRGRGRRYTPVV